MSEARKAVVLVSGGLDSATVLAMAAAQGFKLYALSFKYGQRHAAELTAATQVCEAAGVAHHAVQTIDLRAFGGSALTSEIAVPKARSLDEISTGIPVTYVPARNTIFLSFALGWAEVLGADDIFIGVNALDYSGYPDCREAFIKSFEETANLATKAGVEGHRMTIHTPLLQLTKAQIIEAGNKLGVDYGLTLSCYDPTPEGGHCGQCDACLLRTKGFAQAGMADPAP